MQDFSGSRGSKRWLRSLCLAYGERRCLEPVSWSRLLLMLWPLPLSELCYWQRKALAALEDGLALLQEGARSLLCPRKPALACRSSARSRRPCPREASRSGQRGQDALNGERPVVRDALGDLLGLGQGLPIRHHVVDQPQLIGARSRDASPARSISAAMAYGICRRSRTVEPASGKSPRCTSVTPNSALSPATRMSVAGFPTARKRMAFDRQDYRLLWRSSLSQAFHARFGVFRTR